MLEQLEVLEEGRLKAKPIFPSIVLGHLYMRKYGLSREQRTAVLRSTGGSSRFEDIERVVRASEFEDRRPEGPGKASHHQRRRESALVADASSGSLSPDGLDDSEKDVLEASSGENGFSDDETQEALEEAYEVERKAKDKFKRSARTYKESRKRVQDIRRLRQPHMPVVAIPPEGGAPSNAAPVQATFKYDRKGRKDAKDKKGGGEGRREDVNLLDATTVTEFSYMVQFAPVPEEEALITSVPSGFAVIDTGCTSSVIGEETAQRLTERLAEQGWPKPVELQLPPVHLKGFNGVKTKTEKGLRWTVRLGDLWGTSPHTSCRVRLLSS
jgi:hypothetical protein